MLYLVCVCVRKNASVCVHVCLRLIDAAGALRLIGSHGDCIKRLLRLTFDPENTLLSIGRALSLSPPSHLLTRPHILTFFFLSRPCSRKGKLSFSSPSICPFILLSRSLSNREETRRGPNKRCPGLASANQATADTGNAVGAHGSKPNM